MKNYTKTNSSEELKELKRSGWFFIKTIILIMVVLSVCVVANNRHQNQICVPSYAHGTETC